MSLAHSLYSESIPAMQLWDQLLLRALEDREATIIVVKKGYSPKKRHITRAHKVNLSSLSEVYADGTAIVEFVDTQAADIFTNALPLQKWANALHLLGMRTDIVADLQKPKEVRIAIFTGKCSPWRAVSRGAAFRVRKSQPLTPYTIYSFPFIATTSKKRYVIVHSVTRDGVTRSFPMIRKHTAIDVTRWLK